MKRWKFKWVAIFIAFFGAGYGSMAMAAKDMGIELGARQQGGDVVGLNMSANAQIGFQGGLFAHVPMADSPQVHFRTGLFYTQRPLQSENDITSEKIDFRLDYLDIPIELLFKPNESFGFYIGMLVAINIGTSCSGVASCEVRDIETPYFPLAFGGLYKFTPKFGVNFYAEGASSYVARGLVDFKAVGLNLMYSFE
jgi:hypothetical protein